MAKKKKRKGVRTYTPHSFNTILYPALGLLIIALLAAYLFLPMFSFAKDGEAPLIFTGLDFIKLCLMKFVSFLALPVYQTFLDYFNDATPSNELLVMIVQYHDYIQIAVAAFIALAFLFAIFLLLFVVLWFITGKSEKPTLLNDFAILTVGFFLFGIGLAYMYFFFYHWIIDAQNVTAAINLSIPLLITIGAMALFAFIIHILYHHYFKERVALEKNFQKGANGTHQKSAIMDTSDSVSSQEQAQYIPPSVDDNGKDVDNSNAPSQPLPVYKEKKEKHATQAPLEDVPSGKAAVIRVGDIAYAKNKDIVSAEIPEGIHGLGSSAFADCHELTSVSIPSTVVDIGFDCFKNTPKLKEITYNGTVERWKNVSRGSNWLRKSGTKTVKCLDGQINVDPRH